ncbi:hypothetical protein [Chroococcidiopsis sp.]
MTVRLNSANEAVELQLKRSCKDSLRSPGDCHKMPQQFAIAKRLF